MQERYVGDIGDFAKYSILRAVTANGNIRLGVVWCLFPNESHNSDGRHTSYLAGLQFRGLDSVLHDRLAHIVSSDCRSIQSIRRARIFPLGTVSFELPIALSGQVRREARAAYRAEWLAKALAATAGCDVVFVDPDNGIECPSMPKDGTKGGKYVYFDELRSFWKRGQSLIVYHHLNRTASVEEQTRALRLRFIEKFPKAVLVMSLLFRRGSCRHFWIIGQADHADDLKLRIESMLKSGWHRYFQVG